MMSGPLVSVGIPSYNRPKGLRRTLDCITGQTYKNLEIIISDNCSDDPQVESIIQEFSRRDNRIRYYRQDRNKGAGFNFPFVLEKATGPYFMWAADDDWWDNTYISKCMDVFIKNPDVVLCSTWALLVDADNRVVRQDYHENIDTLGLSRRARLKKVIRGVVFNTHFYGLRKTEITRKIDLKPYYGNDHVLMMQLSYYGSFVILPEVLYSCNISGTGSSPVRILRALGYKSILVTISPSFSIMKSYFEEIVSTKCLTGYEKVFAIIYVIQRYITKPYIVEIIHDLFRLPGKIIQSFRKMVSSLIG